jgi:hypothetical protein
LDDFVYDACAGAITGIQLYDYFNMVVDFAANIQRNSREGLIIFEESAEDINCVTIGISFLM